MSDVPADVIEAAWRAFRQIGITQTILPPCDERIWPIVQAILAERERCSLIADKAAQPGIPGTSEWLAMGNFAGDIRDAILSPSW